MMIAAMTEAAQKIGHMLEKLPLGAVLPGAALPPPTIGNSGKDYATRAFIARVGLTANTPYEAVYWGNNLDTEGRPLLGDNKYEMRFKQEIPYIKPGFWSLTLYASDNNYTVPNPINRYMLGSDSPLKKNSDGSFTIYVQSTNPGPDKESNWLPSPPGRRFYLIPRAYAPAPAAIEVLADPRSWP